MLNIEDFISRIEKLMENHQLSAAAFAEKIGVQRSSVSHILSKRNKPSLDFILKVHHHFEEATLDSLLLGKKCASTPLPHDLEPKNQEEKIHPPHPRALASSEKKSISSHSEEIQQIIQVYKDGSFTVFIPKT
ncbi:MAG: XRE family transcriptional regulator [Flavobacteriia bacterium]|nr:XRE family transcriptional regulator [Flavobacteriia bacterium]